MKRMIRGKMMMGGDRRSSRERVAKKMWGLRITHIKIDIQILIANIVNLSLFVLVSPHHPSTYHLMSSVLTPSLACDPCFSSACALPSSALASLLSLAHTPPSLACTSLAHAPLSSALAPCWLTLITPCQLVLFCPQP